MNRPYINFCSCCDRQWNGSMPVEPCPWCEIESLRKRCQEAASDCDLARHSGTIPARVENWLAGIARKLSHPSEEEEA